MQDKKLAFGEWLFKKRDYTPIPLIIVALYIIWQHGDQPGMGPTALSVGIGAFFIVVGEVIRFWGVSYIGGISRTRTRATGSLMDSGPFSLVRNPLYVGNFFLSLGLVIVSGVYFMVPIYIFFFAVQYHYIVNWEEWNLRAKMGEPYIAYCKEVPRWFPRLSGYRAGANDFKKALRSERNTIGAIIAVSAVLAVATQMGFQLH